MPSCERCGSFVDDSLIKCPFCDYELTSKGEIKTYKSNNLEDDSEIIIQKDSTKPYTIESEQEGSYVFKTPEIEEMFATEKEEEKQFVELEIVPERKYVYWFLLGIITVGIFFLIYLFINIEDLDKHSHYPNDSRGDPIRVNTSQTLMIFIVAICFGFIPILWWIYYKKYASLYYHLKGQKYENAPRKIPHPAFYMIPLITSHLLALVPTIITFITSENIRFTLPALFWSILGIIFILTAITFYLDFLWQNAFNVHNKITITKLNLRNENAHQSIKQ
ncbi:MAG: hypothetical protein FK731_05345 [Asgard group archaeon]|nr:hypothetical protein [Asgard group archaeon]